MNENSVGRGGDGGPMDRAEWGESGDLFWAAEQEARRRARLWNPRYLAYCRAHGAETPEQMVERDRIRWPGGINAGFLSWHGGMLASWFRESGDSATGPLDHARYDAWLERQTPAIAPSHPEPPR